MYVPFLLVYISHVLFYCYWLLFSDSVPVSLLSASLFICLSTHLSVVCLSVCLRLYLFVPIRRKHSLFLSLSLSVHVSLSRSLSLSLSFIFFFLFSLFFSLCLSRPVSFFHTHTHTLSFPLSHTLSFLFLPGIPHDTAATDRYLTGRVQSPWRCREQIQTQDLETVRSSSILKRWTQARKLRSIVYLKPRHCSIDISLDIVSDFKRFQGLESVFVHGSVRDFVLFQ